MPQQRSALADASILDKLKPAYVVIATCGGDEADLAILAGVDVAVVRTALANADTAQALEAERAKAEAEGRAAIHLARKAQFALLQRIAAVAATAEPAEATEYLRPINRILENADRVRLAEREQFDNLPIIHVTFGPGMQIITEADVNQHDSGQRPDVEDAPVKALPDPAPESDDSALLAALGMQVEPLPLEESK